MSFVRISLVMLMTIGALAFSILMLERHPAKAAKMPSQAVALMPWGLGSEGDSSER